MTQRETILFQMLLNQIGWLVAETHACHAETKISDYWYSRLEAMEDEIFGTLASIKHDCDMSSDAFDTLG